MVSVFDWSKRRRIEVYIHSLLFSHNDLAKRIVKLKGDWSRSAVKAVKSGEKYGDVAASIILDVTEDALRDKEGVKRELVQELIDRRQLAELKTSNVVIAYMVALRFILRKDEEFSKALGYDVTNRYARLIAANEEEEKLVGDRLLEFALIAYNGVREFFDARKTIDSIMEMHCEIVDWKLGAFVDREYRWTTNGWLDHFKEEIDNLDVASADFDSRLDMLAEQMRQKVFELNKWAWSRARALIDADLDFVEAKFGDEYDGKAAGEKLADLVEGIVEGHTKQFIGQLGQIRTNKLNERRDRLPGRRSPARWLPDAV